MLHLIVPNKSKEMKINKHPVIQLYAQILFQCTKDSGYIYYYFRNMIVYHFPVWYSED